MYHYIGASPWQDYVHSITNIVLNEGMTSIGASAFADCKYFQSIVIPTTVEKIYDSAFEDCRLLSTLIFAEPSALTSIGNWAFYNCHELKSVVIPEGVTEIGYAAFYGCTYLKELTLPATMQSVADNGFALCQKLEKMHVMATTPPQVDARTFEDVDRKIPVFVPTESVAAYKSAPVWQEFDIQGKEPVMSDLENTHSSSPTTNSQKNIRDGKLIILRDGVEYNIMGQEM